MKFNCFSQPLKAQMAYKQANQLQEEDTPKICISKLKINRPRISFGFFSKNRFWLVDVLGRGGGGQEKVSKERFA